ncbi:MAG: hypothetical protein ACLRJV_23595 [Eubacteriales bacterium]
MTALWVKGDGFLPRQRTTRRKTSFSPHCPGAEGVLAEMLGTSISRVSTIPWHISMR